MEVIFHFIFSLAKISMLASIYAALLLFIFMLIAKHIPVGWVSRTLNKKLRFWFLSGFTISILLFIYMFSYWGDHGLGDGPKIPIGHGLIVENTNWNKYGYLQNIKTSDKKNLETTKFLLTNKTLIGNLDSGFYDYQNAYFILDLENTKLKEFESKARFNAYAKTNNLPNTETLLSFKQNYKNRWGGWRFWLLA